MVYYKNEIVLYRFSSLICNFGSARFQFSAVRLPTKIKEETQ